MILEIIGMGVTSVVTIILSKTRLHLRNDCISCSYNEHQIDLNKLDKVDEEHSDNELPLDSFKTLPPPATPRTRASLPIMDLRTLKR